MQALPREDGPNSAAERRIRELERFIAAHWDKPLSLKQIARQNGCSTRSVHAIFRQTRGRSPMAYLRDVRLEHAREMLRHPEPHSSVTNIALACSFNSFGHFARHYRLRFGELPSETFGLRTRRQLEDYGGR